MPSPVPKSKIKVPKVAQEDLLAIPIWARSNFTESYQLYNQLTTQIVKLEKAIADMESMELKQECPRSLQIKIEVKVKDAQQQAMDTALFAAKKAFEKSVLTALITARKSELSEIKNSRSKIHTDLNKFIMDTLENLISHNIQIEEQNDRDIQSTVQYVHNLFSKNCEAAEQAIKTQHLFDVIDETRRKQRREEEAQERRINEELQDKSVKELQNRIQRLEDTVQKASRNGRKRKQQISRKSDQKNQRSSPQSPNGQRSKSHFQDRPKSKKKKKGNSGSTKNQPIGRKQNQGQERGNPRHRRRYTNTMTRSVSLPPNSRRKQN